MGGWQRPALTQLANVVIARVHSAALRDDLAAVRRASSRNACKGYRGAARVLPPLLKNQPTPDNADIIASLNMLPSMAGYTAHALFCGGDGVLPTSCGGSKPALLKTSPLPS
jgi:hypothetical protein